MPNEADDNEVLISLAGKCLAAAGEGEDCAERGCLSGLSCQVGAGGATCEAVVLLDDGEACNDDSECKSDTCIEVIENGACFDTDVACTSDDDCANDDFCDGDFTDVCGGADDVVVEICDGK